MDSFSKRSKLDSQLLLVAQQVKSVDYYANLSPKVITSTVNIAIDIILEAIGLLDGCDDKASGQIRSKLYDAIDRLRSLFPKYHHHHNNPEPNLLHINRLPDDCLGMIFSKQFSLQSMFATLRSVCTRWKAVVECLVCAPKRSLKLFGSLADVRLYCHRLVDLNLYEDKKFKLRELGCHDHDLMLHGRSWNKDFDLEFFSALGSIFPNVEHLVLGLGNVSGDEVDQLGHIITQWPRLVRLSLMLNWDPNEQRYYLEELDENLTQRKSLSSLFRTVNSLTSLKQLDLVGQSMTHYNFDYDDHHLSRILPRLEHFSLQYVGHCETGSILKCLGSNLKSLRLDDFCNCEMPFQKFLSEDVALNLTKLRLSPVVKRDSVEFICDRLSQLERLEMNFYSSEEVPFILLDSSLITSLNKLSNLQELSLENFSIQLDNPLDSMPPLYRPPIVCSPIASLHLTNLNVSPSKTDGSELVHYLAAHFPKLDQLEYQFGMPNDDIWAFTGVDCKLSEAYVRKAMPGLVSCRVYYGHSEARFLTSRYPIREQPYPRNSLDSLDSMFTCSEELAASDDDEEDNRLSCKVMAVIILTVLLILLICCCIRWCKSSFGDDDGIQEYEPPFNLPADPRLYLVLFQGCEPLPHGQVAFYV